MNKSDSPRTLLDMPRSSDATIISLPSDAALRSQCIRLGLAIGAQIRCTERLPGGTVVLSTNRQEIALGRALAVEIGVASPDASHPDLPVNETPTSSPDSSISDPHIQ